jgi:serine/threonine protein kinase
MLLVLGAYCFTFFLLDIEANTVNWPLQLNDFNRSRFIAWNAKTEEACPFYIPVNGGRFRSPEEYTDKSALTEKIDVYSLGNLLWSILKEETVWPSVESKDVQKNVREGIFPTISSDESDNYTAMEKAVIHAMEMCFVMDVDKRNTSIEVEKYLRKQLKKFGVSEI